MTLSYTTAKKLKDAGFESKSGYIMCRYPEIDEFELGKVMETVPTPILSELIEACGEKFDYLDSPLWNDEDDDGWFCIGRVDFGCTGKGNTPEEAVANLILALLKAGHVFKNGVLTKE